MTLRYRSLTRPVPAPSRDEGGAREATRRPRGQAPASRVWPPADARKGQQGREEGACGQAANELNRPGRLPPHLRGSPRSRVTFTPTSTSSSPSHTLWSLRAVSVGLSFTSCSFAFPLVRRPLNDPVPTARDLQRACPMHCASLATASGGERVATRIVCSAPCLHHGVAPEPMLEAGSPRCCRRRCVDVALPPGGRSAPNVGSRASSSVLLGVRPGCGLRVDD